MNVGKAQACMFPKTVEKSIEENNTIFSARVASCTQGENGEVITFQTKKVWKGEIQPKYYFLTSCSNSYFKIDEDYLVYANSSDENKFIEPSYRIAGCERTQYIPNMWDRIKDGIYTFKMSMSYWRALTLSDWKEQVLYHWIDKDFKELGKPIHEYK